MNIWLIIFIGLVIIMISLLYRYWKTHNQDKQISKLKKSLGTTKHPLSNYHRLISLYEQKINEGGRDYGMHCRRLADLYYAGSESGDIPSNPKMAIKWYRKAIEFGGDLVSLIYLGDIYRNGVHGIIEPDPKFAWDCYQKSLEYTENKAIATMANERMHEMQDEPIEVLEDFANMEPVHAAIPETIDPFADSIWNNLFDQTVRPGIEIEDRVLEPITHVPDPEPEPVIDRDITHVHIPVPRQVPRQVPIPRQNVIRPNQAPGLDNEIRNDPQNSHDTTLLRGARDTINKLRMSTPVTIETPVMLRQLRSQLNDIDDHTRRNKAIRVLDKIESNDLPMSNMQGMHEVDILNLVYNRIKSPINKDRQNDLMEVLVDQLCDGFGRNSPVCATGRCTRVLSSLDATDAEADKIVTMKPKWAIKQELLNNASRIREKMLEEKGKEFEKMYNKMDQTPEEENQAETFDTDFKQALQDQYKKEYVESGIMTQSDLDTEVNKWIDHI